MIRDKIQKLFGQSDEEPPQVIRNVTTVKYYPNEQKAVVYVSDRTEPYEILDITTVEFESIWKVTVTTDDEDGELSASIYTAGSGYRVICKQFGNGKLGIKDLGK